MARWRLTEDHYINVYRVRRGSRTEWEYTETDRITGEEERTRFPVPLYCEKETIVAVKGTELSDDNTWKDNSGRMRGPGPIVFVDEPKVTPAMEPLDDEARAISAAQLKDVQHPIESLPGQGFNNNLLEGLQRQLAELAARTPVPVQQSGVSVEEFNALKEQLATLIAEKAEREAKPSTVGAIKRKVA